MLSSAVAHNTDIPSVSPSSVPASVRDVLPPFLEHPTVLRFLRLTVAEDVDPDGTWTSHFWNPVRNDLTSRATLDAEASLDAQIVAKESGVVAGVPLARALCVLVDTGLEILVNVEEGARVEAGEVLATLRGPGPALLTAERPALNVLGQLSGIATKTRHFVDAVNHTDAEIFDTRKTLPGARRPSKYAVQQGGGRNHRLGLFDMVLIKDNHIEGAGSIAEAVERTRSEYGDEYPVEVEVTTVEELSEALAAAPDVILLDNMDASTLRTAVARTDGRVPLEASGNVTLETVRTVAETGVDRISVGGITHSAPAFDVSLRVT